MLLKAINPVVDLVSDVTYKPGDVFMVDNVFWGQCLIENGAVIPVQMDLNVRAGVLLTVSDVEKVLVESASYAVMEFNNAFTALVHEINGKYDLQIDEQARLAITSQTLLKVKHHAEGLVDHLIKS